MSLTINLVYLSSLDLKHFGIRTARAADVTLNNLPAIIKFCNENQVELLIAKCNPEHTPAIHAMEDHGFRLMDTIVYYTFNLLTQKIPAYREHEEAIREAAPGDEFAVKQIAKKAFSNYTGHYHADPKLDKKKCTGVYASWAYNCCISKEFADAVQVAEVQGTVVGFSALKKFSGSEWIAVLGAVDPEYQKSGFAKALNIARMKYCIGQKAEYLSSPISITNSTGQIISRQYQYRPSRFEHTFHKWFI